MNGATMLELEMASDPDRLPDVRTHVRRWITLHGWSEQQAGEIVLALDEALSNVIRHGYADHRGDRILVRIEAVDDPEHGPGVEIRVRDFGRQVDPARIRGRDLSDVRPGGLGVHIIRAMTSSAEYRHADGGGMLLIMRKFKSHTADGSAGSREHE